jgi:hypothetical protein
MLNNRERFVERALTLNPSPQGRGTFLRACLPFSLWEKGLGDEGAGEKFDAPVFGLQSLCRRVSAAKFLSSPSMHGDA